MDEFRFANPRRRKTDNSQGIPTLTQVVAHSTIPEFSRLPEPKQIPTLTRQNSNTLNSNQRNTNSSSNINANNPSAEIPRNANDIRPRYEGHTALANNTQAAQVSGYGKNTDVEALSGSSARSQFTNNPPPRRSALHDNITPQSAFPTANTNNTRVNSLANPPTQFPAQNLANKEMYQRQFSQANNINAANNPNIPINSPGNTYLNNNQADNQSRRERQIIDKINQLQSGEGHSQFSTDQQHYARAVSTANNAANSSHSSLKQQNIDPLNSRSRLPNDWQNISEAVNSQMPSMPQPNDQANLSPRVRQLINNANENYQQLAAQPSSFNQPNGEAANRVSSILNQKPNPSSIQPVIRHVNHENPQDLRPRAGLINRFTDRFDNLATHSHVESTPVISPQVEAAALNVLSAELSYAISKQLTSDLPIILENSFKRVIQSLENEIREGINISAQNAIREFLEERDRVTRNK